MKLSHLKQFTELKKFESLNKASEELYISHQALSQVISSLEKEFQTQLLHRSRKGISFTENGIYLEKKAHEIIHLLEDTKLQIKSSYLKKQANTITLYTDCITDTHIIPKFLPYFNNHYSFMQFNIVITPNTLDDPYYFTEQFDTLLKNIVNTQDAFGLFSVFSTETPQLLLPEQTTHNLLSVNEIYIATKRDSIATNFDTVVLNERELGQHSTILKYLSPSNPIYVKSQRQCFLSLKDDNVATVSFEQNHYIESFNAKLSPFPTPLFLYTYIIGPEHTSEFTKTIQTLLKQLF